MVVEVSGPGSGAWSDGSRRSADPRAESLASFRTALSRYSWAVEADPAIDPEAEAAFLRERLRSLRRRSAPPVGMGGLSPRQLEIARLVAEGLTNRQIAEALVLTEGTVANHVRAILLRLGLVSRTQLATWIVRREQAV